MNRHGSAAFIVASIASTALSLGCRNVSTDLVPQGREAFVAPPPELIIEEVVVTGESVTIKLRSNELGAMPNGRTPWLAAHGNESASIILTLTVEQPPVEVDGNPVLQSVMIPATNTSITTLIDALNNTTDAPMVEFYYQMPGSFSDLGNAANLRCSVQGKLFYAKTNSSTDWIDDVTFEHAVGAEPWTSPR